MSIPPQHRLAQEQAREIFHRVHVHSTLVSLLQRSHKVVEEAWQRSGEDRHLVLLQEMDEVLFKIGFDPNET